jgi:hypothetical protein
MSNPSPTYTFTVNLKVLSRYSWAHPDSTQESVDDRSVQFSTWMPGLLRGNYQLKDGNTLVAYGLQGKYLYDNFTTGTDPMLTFVSVT